MLIKFRQTITFVELLCSFALCYGCSSGWKQYQNKCYKFSDNKLTFTEAGAHCSTSGGKLAEPQTSGENSFIEEQISVIPNSKDVDYFIGITDIFEQDAWLYISTLTPVRPYVSGWRYGEPNNYGGHPEDCVFIRGGLSGWLDGSCYTAMHFVCEQAAYVSVVFNGYSECKRLQIR